MDQTGHTGRSTKVHIDMRFAKIVMGLQIRFFEYFSYRLFIQSFRFIPCCQIYDMF